MPLYGYSRQVVNDVGLHELREVSLAMPAERLRRVAAFLLDCADQMDGGDLRTDHIHIGQFDRNWSRTGEDDIIVINAADD